MGKVYYAKVKKSIVLPSNLTSVDLDGVLDFTYRQNDIIVNVHPDLIDNLKEWSEYVEVGEY